MYHYEDHKPFVFTEEGQVRFLRIRDRVQELLKASGAVRLQEAISGISGDLWQTLACFDRLVELGELQWVNEPHYRDDIPTQHRVYVSGRR